MLKNFDYSLYHLNFLEINLMTLLFSTLYKNEFHRIVFTIRDNNREISFFVFILSPTLPECNLNLYFFSYLSTI